MGISFRTVILLIEAVKGKEENMEKLETSARSLVIELGYRVARTSYHQNTYARACDTIILP